MLYYCHALSVVEVISHASFDITWAMVSAQAFESVQSEVGLWKCTVLYVDVSFLVSVLLSPALLARFLFKNIFMLVHVFNSACNYHTNIPE